jgi:hypothetical protein
MKFTVTGSDAFGTIVSYQTFNRWRDVKRHLERLEIRRDLINTAEHELPLTYVESVEFPFEA